MIFTNYIEITDDELKAAEREASQVTEEAFESWLSSWTEWERQERLEVAESLDWKELDVDESVNASQIPASNLSGEPLDDPVVYKGQIWSLRDLLRHWVRTGLDLTNMVLLPKDFVGHVKRVILSG
eukprot:CAMPEP_0184528316 /NCGR_PEP_ID=MMETSP0198_2-20121128/11724_1 /TAXON_ID=1112570 /ORGANISM="Thraustochytrium sp., Strain LLF1b" /LENGTH=125 /DNA_ID=CAMNT_0026920149 /DNA_START=678 /DNA_END=1055 /DNA_ORIENTATION=-